MTKIQLAIDSQVILSSIRPGHIRTSIGDMLGQTCQNLDDYPTIQIAYEFREGDKFVLIFLANFAQDLERVGSLVCAQQNIGTFSFRG